METIDIVLTGTLGAFLLTVIVPAAVRSICELIKSIKDLEDK